MARARAETIGLWVLLSKIGFKLVTVGLKFLGFAAKGAKGGLAVATFGTYAYLLSWQFAAIIMLQLFVHESGHIWAMRRHGLRVRGIYFIPLMGAAAVSDDDLARTSRADEVVIAMMGPAWGFSLALVVAVLYLATGSEILAAAAAWMCLVNLFNFLPLNPLDGGRVIKSVAFSFGSWWGVCCMSGMLLCLFILACVAGAGLFLFLGVLQIMECLGEFWATKRKRKAQEEKRKIREELEFRSFRRLILAPGLSVEQAREEAKSLYDDDPFFKDEEPSPRRPLTKGEIIMSLLAYVGLALVMFLVMNTLGPETMEVLK